ncbi:RNA polymerase III-inhibiting protein maf1 [Saccharomyces pastorianus]|uniref:RNA polymerase III-inhibiting protein maf1 n=2 Tax=Saccharomyces TaxID=4930 RepID=A0A6C1E657_SACPS|nr:RNA polymerase III-inhibiting protein maf1 [Saccharomyces pastorianus]
MKFIDELDIERVNQTLNFETNDCKIVGSCDIFTTKAVASDRKLYKTIDQHFDTILQENENYNATLQQQLAAPEPNQPNQPPCSSPLYPNRRDSNSFWEQKRRISISEYNNNTNNNNTSNSSSGSNNNHPGASNTPPTTFFKSAKLNDQNLKELVSNYDSGSMSSSSLDSSFKNHEKMRRRSSSSISSFKSGKSSNHNSNNAGSTTNNVNKRRKSSINERPSNLNLGPFGPINEPSSRKIFAYLIAILNASYPDHDFSSVEPTDFVKTSLKTFISKFENTLYSLGRQPEEWIWEVINSHMTLSDCVLFQYSPSNSFLEDEPGYLWNLIGFLYNKKRKRVAYLYLICSRLNSNTSEVEDASVKELQGKLIIDDGSNEYEGEYDFTYDENVIDDKSDHEGPLH